MKKKVSKRRTAWNLGTQRAKGVSASASSAAAGRRAARRKAGRRPAPPASASARGGGQRLQSRRDAVSSIVSRIAATRRRPVQAELAASRRSASSMRPPGNTSAPPAKAMPAGALDHQQLGRAAAVARPGPGSRRGSARRSSARLGQRHKAKKKAAGALAGRPAAFVRTKFGRSLHAVDGCVRFGALAALTSPRRSLLRRSPSSRSCSAWLPSASASASVAHCRPARRDSRPGFHILLDVLAERVVARAAAAGERDRGRARQRKCKFLHVKSLGFANDRDRITAVSQRPTPVTLAAFPAPGAVPNLEKAGSKPYLEWAGATRLCR
jgi:hypothetical protein